MYFLYSSHVQWPNDQTLPFIISWNPELVSNPAPLLYAMLSCFYKLRMYLRFKPKTTPVSDSIHPVPTSVHELIFAQKFIAFIKYYAT